MYASLSDVRALAPYVPISAASQPTEGQVQGWISDTENIVDAALGNLGFEVPITGPKSVAIVKLLIANAVMAMVMRARPNPESDPALFQAWFDQRMKALRDPADPFDLPDAVHVDTVIKTGDVLRVSSNFRDLALDDSLVKITRDIKF
jgi:hypothetical protein